MNPLDECEQKAGSVSLAERALSIEHSIATLGDPDEEECERLWAAEAERRYAEYKKGNISAQTADEVFRNARAGLASVR
ncbi:MAG: Putative addiction module component [Candidatus Kentron sp. G]|nr:MAG: Putative addiction module component [Candidatus Kentron sp. G]VFN03949.1 MAG: Putative addiction module component [Candidatus Kentron sp. G]VFN04215.1 MAG: Putative addiction module component [Candidatus Kentron sp. G]